MVVVPGWAPLVDLVPALSLSPNSSTHDPYQAILFLCPLDPYPSALFVRDTLNLGQKIVRTVAFQPSRNIHKIVD